MHRSLRLLGITRDSAQHGKGGKRREVGMDRWAWEHYSDVLVMPTPPS